MYVRDEFNEKLSAALRSAVNRTECIAATGYLQGQQHFIHILAFSDCRYNLWKRLKIIANVRELNTNK